MAVFRVFLTSGVHPLTALRSWQLGVWPGDQRHMLDESQSDADRALIERGAFTAWNTAAGEVIQAKSM
ncbi:hypothetical protein EYF80_035348 [Liparis tanakae]|uniref:Uncharacterized protein n=1 Tax=Liparis tanakae TaxID=230148 RepID=A0A4Z2GM93_9TELE|nr:hypothetical protein EYF80_035348 [Liparis tanakae]